MLHRDCLLDYWDNKANKDDVGGSWVTDKRELGDVMVFFCEEKLVK